MCWTGQHLLGDGGEVDDDARKVHVLALSDGGVVDASNDDTAVRLKEWMLTVC